MSILNKLGTLFRAGVRESAEGLTDANAIRIYQQEIVDAQQTLTHRREAIAEMIATRKELEEEILSLQGRVSSRERQIAGLPAQERNEELLQLAAQDIATTENHLDDLKQRHVSVCRLVNCEEITLRRLLTEITEHRRDLKLMAAQVQRQRSGGGLLSGQTVTGRLAALRETRDSIRGTVSAHDHSEAGMKEAIERIETSALDRKLRESGCDRESERIAAVLARLRGMEASA